MIDENEGHSSIKGDLLLNAIDFARKELLTMASTHYYLTFMLISTGIALADCLMIGYGTKPEYYYNIQQGILAASSLTFSFGLIVHAIFIPEVSLVVPI
jgi:hypothetical protein